MFTFTVDDFCQLCAGFPYLLNMFLVFSIYFAEFLVGFIRFQ